MAPLPSPFYRNGILLSSGLLTLVALVLLPPFVSAGAAETVMAAFAPVCHQLPGRSPHIEGTALAVCHRCFGAYAGLFMGSLVFLFSSGRSMPSIRPVLLLIVAALPGVIDWSGDVLGLWTNSPISRIITGGWFGVLAGMLLASAVLESVIPTPYKKNE